MVVVRYITMTVLFLLALVSHQSLTGASSLESLPPGEYYYEQSSLSGNRSYVLLRKSGRTVIGLDVRSIRERPCFRGFLDGDRIINATRVFPPYQPDSDLEHQDGVMLDLAQYQQVDRASSEFDRETLWTCIQFFSR